MTSGFRAATHSLQRDLGHLPLRDRAVIRILNRAGAVTAAQLTALAYGNRRVAQERLGLLWRLGFLERMAVPTAAGGPAYAYRPSAATLRRLGYRRHAWRGPGYLAHTLDAVEAVCALVRSGGDQGQPPVQLWLPESMATAVLEGVEPDAIVVLATNAGTGVVCLEIDEATQHAVPIRDKLEAYRRALEGRQGWHVVFVVPTLARLAWLKRRAARTTLSQTSVWGATAEDLHANGARAPLDCLHPGRPSTILRDVTAESRNRRSAAPVATGAWLELLGSGGGEELSDILA